MGEGLTDSRQVAGRPLVTVVICVYNAGAYLRPSLESILCQTYRELEILIIDDGSTDGCFDSISDLSDARIRLLRQKNSGKPAALNRAIEEMKGEFYAIHDADDLSHPTRIERQVECFLANPQVAAVYCGNELILNDFHVAPTRRPKGIEECSQDIAAFRMPAHDPTGMYRVSMVRGMEYELYLHLGEGHDYILRVGEKFPMIVLGECLYSYRIHRNSITKRVPELREQCVARVLQRACNRRGLDFARTFPHVTSESAKSARNRSADNNLAAHFIQSVLDLRRAGSYGKAISTGWACVGLHPFDPHYYKALVYAIAPAPAVSLFRRRASNGI